MASIFWAIVVIATAYAVFKILSLGSVYLLPSRLGRYAHGSADGQPPWALVTGASDGIGRALSHELAAQGFNVVLHGRNEAKLAHVMSTLQSEYPQTSFRVLVADASAVPCMACLQRGPAPSAVDFDAILAAVADLHLTVLINNAGGGPADPCFAPLGGCSAARVTANISLNALFPFHLTRVLLPVLSRNAPSLVVNVSSLADAGFPLLVSYSASKQFLINMTRAVRREMALQGRAGEVELLGVRVGKVTGVSRLQENPSLFTPDAQDMARAILARVGRGHDIVVGHWAHALLQFTIGLLPAWAEDLIILEAMRRVRASELSKRA